MSKPSIEEILAPKPEAKPRIYAYRVAGGTRIALPVSLFEVGRGADSERVFHSDAASERSSGICILHPAHLRPSGAWEWRAHFKIPVNIDSPGVPVP